MTEQELKKANEIYEKIKVCKETLANLSLLLSHNYQPRQAFFNCNSLEKPLIIPSAIFKKVAKAIKEEHRKNLKQLEDEFKSIGNDSK